MTILSLILLVALVGVFIAIQGPINSHLGRAIGSPWTAALISFLVGTVALAAVVLSQPSARTALRQCGQAPWWAWTGGLLGACYVTVVIATAPRLGMAMIIGVSVAGSVAASLVIDHLGAFGLPEQPITPLRLLGATLVCAGVALVRWAA
jgi:transporter family-2 protein